MVYVVAGLRGHVATCERDAFRQSGRIISVKKAVLCICVVLSNLVLEVILLCWLMVRPTAVALHTLPLV